MPAEYYIDCIRVVPRSTAAAALECGQSGRARGHHNAALTVEGEKDDISPGLCALSRIDPTPASRAPASSTWTIAARPLRHLGAAAAGATLPTADAAHRAPIARRCGDCPQTCLRTLLQSSVKTTSNLIRPTGLPCRARPARTQPRSEWAPFDPRLHVTEMISCSNRIHEGQRPPVQARRRPGVDSRHVEDSDRGGLDAALRRSCRGAGGCRRRRARQDAWAPRSLRSPRMVALHGSPSRTRRRRRPTPPARSAAAARRARC